MENINYGKTGIKFLSKRDAEADPGFFYATGAYAYPYSGLHYPYTTAYAGYPYTFGYTGYPYYQPYAAIVKAQ